MITQEMNINIKATNLELTDPINEYVIKRVTNLGKLLQKIQDAGGEVLVSFEVAKTTNHHNAGQIFHADCSIVIDGDQFYSSSDKEDLYEAIDDCKDQLFHEIRKTKEKKTTLLKRGAQKIKDLIRGISK